MLMHAKVWTKTRGNPDCECDDTEFVTLGGLVVGPKPFGAKGL